ncbi:hypothetical protein [Streptomyces sp. cg40]|uniref:hypothetical protein n=1 Tax=Streptomyces sp. cg40 TaxID=3419764 RepID=UPI003D0691AB
MARRRFTGQLSASAPIFALSIPPAYVNTTAARWFWATVVPMHYVIGHYRRRLARP